MKQEALAYFSDAWLTLIALIIFFTFFCVMVYRVKIMSSQYIDKMSHLPFEELKHGKQ